MTTNNSNTVSLYVVKNSNGKYFAGFDSQKSQTNFADNPIHAKKFTNKNDIKLRPEEQVVELTVTLTADNVVVSEPFRPHRKFPQK
jgi:predicted GIY-YIG superfamily endonuclease